MADPASAADLAAQLAEQADQLISCLIAFYVVARFWRAHHRVFRRVAGHHEGLAWWNFAFLFTSTAMPFTSSLLGQYGNKPLAVDIFAVNVLFASLATQAALLFGQRRDVLIAPADPAETRARGARVTVVVIAVACSVALAWVNTSAAKYCWLLIPLAPWTGLVVARRAARARSWPENHLAEMADAVAGLAVAVAAVFCYWAAGGSFGLSAAQPHPSWALQASRAAGAVIAAAGMLGLAGRWGHQTRFWLPAALAWIGSGSLAAFDGLELLLNQLMPGTGAPGSGWSLDGTVLVIEVAIGVSCAAVGALTVTAAARDDQKPAGTKPTGTQAGQSRRRQKKSDDGPWTGSVEAIGPFTRPLRPISLAVRREHSPGRWARRTRARRAPAGKTRTGRMSSIALRSRRPGRDHPGRPAGQG